MKNYFFYAKGFIEDLKMDCGRIKFEYGIRTSGFRLHEFCWQALLAKQRPGGGTDLRHPGTYCGSSDRGEQIQHNPHTSRVLLATIP